MALSTQQTQTSKAFSDGIWEVDKLNQEEIIGMKIQRGCNVLRRSYSSSLKGNSM